MALPTGEDQMSEGGNLSGIKYVAVVQDVDRLIFARYDCDPEVELDYADFVLQILGAPDYRHQTTAGSLYSLQKQDIDRTFHMLLQEEESEVRLVYFAITNLSFSQLRAGEFLRQLRRSIDNEFPTMIHCTLNDEKTADAQPLIKSLVDQYAHVHDALEKAAASIEKLKEDTVATKQELDNAINAAKHSLHITDEQKEKAKEFEERALELKKSEWRKQCRRKLIFSLIAAIVIAVIILVAN